VSEGAQHAPEDVSVADHAVRIETMRGAMSAGSVRYSLGLLNQALDTRVA